MTPSSSLVSDCCGANYSWYLKWYPFDEWYTCDKCNKHCKCTPKPKENEVVKEPINQNQFIHMLIKKLIEEPTPLTPTPRTDAVMFQGKRAMYDESRQLERDLIAMTEMADKLSEELETTLCKDKECSDCDIGRNLVSHFTTLKQELEKRK